MISQAVGSQTAGSPSPRRNRGGLSSRSASSNSHSRQNNKSALARGMLCIRGSFLFFFGSYPGLLLLATGYMFGGAAIFLAIESDHSVKQSSELDKRRLEVLDNLWRMQTDNITSSREWTDITTQLMVKWEEYVLDNPSLYASLGSWNWLQALYFAGTSLLTVGHGDVILATANGKGAFILYLTLGIPLFILFLADMGYTLAIGLKYCCAFVSRRLRRKRLQKRAKENWEDDGGKLETVVQQKDSKAVVELIRAIHKDNNVVLMNHAPQNILMEKLASHGGTSKRNSQGLEADSLGEAAYKDGSGEAEPEGMFSKGSSISHLSLTELPRPVSPVPSLQGISRETMTLRQEVDHIEIPLLVVALILVLYVIISSAFVMKFQSRSFLDSLYICFVVISTVGLTSALYPRNSNEQLGILLYALAGALVLSMCIHLISPSLRRFLKFLGKRYKRRPILIPLASSVKKQARKRSARPRLSSDGGHRERRRRRFSFQLSKSSKGNNSLEENKTLVKTVGPWPPTAASNRRRDFALSLQLSRARQRREGHYSPRTVRYTNEIIYMYTGWKCNEVFDNVEDDDYDYTEETPEVVVHTNGVGGPISGSSSRNMEAEGASIQSPVDAVRDANLGSFQPETKNSDYFDSRETSSAGGEIMEFDAGWIDIERDYSDLFACEDENGQNFEELPCW